MSFTAALIASGDASLRKSLITALPPGFSTRYISLSRLNRLAEILEGGSAVDEIEHVGLERHRGRVALSKRDLDPRLVAFSVAMRTNDLLMSSPTMRYEPSFASSMARNPGSGATSSTVLPLGS